MSWLLGVSRTSGTTRVSASADASGLVPGASPVVRPAAAGRPDGQLDWLFCRASQQRPRPGCSDLLPVHGEEGVPRADAGTRRGEW